MFNPHTFTVESVTRGHPDKICDQISDAVVDACLAKDPKSRVAIESFGGHGHLVIGGEVTTNVRVDFEKIARGVYSSIGYGDDLDITVYVTRQSPDIAQGVDTGGAGDQGIMYGYATDETKEYMPRDVVIVHKLAQGLEDLRTSGKFRWLKPDGKTQVTVVDGKIKAILVSTQHDKEVNQAYIKDELTRHLISPVVGDMAGVEILVNPTGIFVHGGFEADTGLTGRKLMVDTYCGLVPHGGGCFSGKDPTKVDRSASYMARFAAKNLVANGFAKKCLVAVAYAIGRPEPLMVYAENEDGGDISALAGKHFDFRPRAIIERLGLERPIFLKTASYGHFGRPGFPWEEVVRL